MVDLFVEQSFTAEPIVCLFCASQSRPDAALMHCTVFGGDGRFILSHIAI